MADKVQAAFELVQPVLTGLTLHEVAALSGKILAESHFHLNDAILESFLKNIDFDCFTGYLCKTGDLCKEQ